MEIADLMKMSQGNLDDLFKKSPPGPIPEGDSQGTAVVCPGTFWTRSIARFVHGFAWQGKVFTKSPSGNDATLENKVSVAGVKAIVARVYYTPSDSTGRSASSLITQRPPFSRKIRDEIRLVDEARKIYLGKVWWGKTRLVDFALQFPN